LPVKNKEGLVALEKEILEVVVDEEHSEEIFEYIYEQADMNKPQGGMIYMHPLMQSSECVLPGVSEEEL